MSKKLILVFAGVIFFFSYHLVFASLSIDEIMYDLSGSDSTNSKSGEWVEVYNPDGSAVSVDASKWRIYDGSANRTINDETDFSIPANSYVVFAGDKDTFLADNPNFSGTVYDTGITSLNNNGATLKILDQDGNVVDSVTYTSSEGGAGDGNSLQLINGSWVGATPTPGVANVSANTVVSSTSSDAVVGGGLPANNVVNNSSSPTVTSATTSQNQAESPNIKTKIIGQVINFVGIPVSFNATTTGYGGEKIFFGKYFWNFGDGDSKEIDLTNSKTFSHTFYYTGDYVVSLDYYENYYSGNLIPDATDQIDVKIIPADISISNVGDSRDFFVELTNNTSYSADISGWILSSTQKSFVFPKNTIVASKDKITLSPKITNFSIADENTLKLSDSQGNIIFDYLSPPTVPIMTATVDKPTDVGRLEASRRPTSGMDIPAVNSLTAKALQNDVENSNNPTPSFSLRKILIFITSFVLIGASAYAVYFIRRKKVAPKEDGSDFEILDE